MFTSKMWKIYNRWLIFAVLLGCLLVVSGTEAVSDTSSAALCTVDCDDSYRRCNDSCDTACAADSTDPICLSCVSACTDQWDSCLVRAVTCTKAPTYNKRCDANWADHCYFDQNGVKVCDHSGYFEVCTNSGGQCVSCPDHEICTGSNGLPPCF
jgi:hypothetical protein